MPKAFEVVLAMVTAESFEPFVLTHLQSSILLHMLHLVLLVLLEFAFLGWVEMLIGLKLVLVTSVLRRLDFSLWLEWVVTRLEVLTTQVIVHWIVA